MFCVCVPLWRTRCCTYGLEELDNVSDQLRGELCDDLINKDTKRQPNVTTFDNEHGVPGMLIPSIVENNSK